RTLVSVVGMGGLGKTTLAKHAFGNQLVKNHFDCRFYISASQSNIENELLIGMIKKFCEDSNEPVPQNLKDMDDIALIEYVRQYLEPKRYLVWFDDVRKVNFSDEIAYAMADNNRGSRIIVTTRNKDAADNFKAHFSVHIHDLKPLPKEKALELFCKKAFSGKCPKDLEKKSEAIVEKCGGLPLAIVIVGGILSTKSKTLLEWEAVSKDLGMELDGNVRITKLTTILSWSYDDLPWRLKSCMLYFGIYPENYTINCKRLTRQWIAEGFVMSDRRRTLEEVAEEYLKELIQTSLVQVSSVGIDGKVKS
ncbi:disease resistance protein, partial [Trifolium medium]|nr:disease resistance protein [Trifolium medium]